jgi:hypothetical protein
MARGKYWRGLRAGIQLRTGAENVAAALDKKSTINPVFAVRLHNPDRPLPTRAVADAHFGVKTICERDRSWIAEKNFPHAIASSTSILFDDN